MLGLGRPREKALTESPKTIASSGMQRHLNTRRLGELFGVWHSPQVTLALALDNSYVLIWFDFTNEPGWKVPLTETASRDLVDNAIPLLKECMDYSLQLKRLESNATLASFSLRVETRMPGLMQPYNEVSSTGQRLADASDRLKDELITFVEHHNSQLDDWTEEFNNGDVIAG